MLNYFGAGLLIGLLSDALLYLVIVEGLWLFARDLLWDEILLDYYY